MDPLAAMYLERQIKKARMRQIGEAAEEIRRLRKEIAPLQEKYGKYAASRRRMDGAQGFQMVDK